MFNFANFVRKVNFERPHFQTAGIIFPNFYLFKLSSLRESEESCFKVVPTVPFDKYFYHWNVHFCKFYTKNRLRAITVPGGEHGICWLLIVWFVFNASVRLKFVSKLQKFRWTNAFTIEMFIFANFVKQ